MTRGILVVGVFTVLGALLLLRWPDPAQEPREQNWGATISGLLAYLHPTACSVEGVVTDSEGRPIEGKVYGTVEIEGLAFSEYDTSNWEWFADTDESGRYRFDCPVSTVFCWANAEGHAPGDIRTFRVERGRVETNLRLAVADAAVVELVLEGELRSSGRSYSVIALDPWNRVLGRAVLRGGSTGLLSGMPRGPSSVTLYGERAGRAGPAVLLSRDLDGMDQGTTRVPLCLGDG